MAGTTIDIRSLQSLHTASSNFSKKVNVAIEELRTEINKLSDPDFLDGFRGGQGDQAVEAIGAGRQALEQLVVSLRHTTNFLDSKIGGAYELQKDKHGFSDAKDTQSRNAQHANIKKN